jgi:hypothetical protein
MDEYNFCTIIEQFCMSLIDLLTIIKDPIHAVNGVIKSKKFRTNVYDNYISHLSDFNMVLSMIIDHIRSMIIQMKILFVEKSFPSLIQLLGTLKYFLQFVKEKDVYHTLFNFQVEFENSARAIKNQNKIIKNINKLRDIIVTIVCLSLEITAIIFPQIAPIGVATGFMKESKMGMEDIEDEQYVPIDIEDVIHKLLDISINSELILRIDHTNILQNLRGRDDFILLLSNLQVQYSEFFILQILLNSEIKEYYKKPRNIFIKIGRFIFFCKSSEVKL